MDTEGYFTKGDMLDYVQASTKAKTYLANILNIYCADKSFSWMMSDRIKSLKSINDKIDRKRIEKGDKFDPRVSLTDIAGVRIVFYDKKATIISADDFRKCTDSKTTMDILDEKIHNMSAKEFEIEFEKSKLYSENYDVSNLYDFVDMLARTWNRVVVIKDYIMYQKESGYQSLHVIINVPVETTDDFGNDIIRYCPVEIQFRNYSQHLYNECEHARYKGDEYNSLEFEDVFDRTKRFLLSSSNEAITNMISSDRQYLLIRKHY